MITYINGDYSYQLLNIKRVVDTLYFDTKSDNNDFVVVEFKHFIGTILGEQIYRDINHKTSLKFDIEESDNPLMKQIIIHVFYGDI